MLVFVFVVVMGIGRMGRGVHVKEKFTALNIEKENDFAKSEIARHSGHSRARPGHPEACPFVNHDGFDGFG